MCIIITGTVTSRHVEIDKEIWAKLQNVLEEVSTLFLNLLVMIGVKLGIMNIFCRQCRIFKNVSEMMVNA